MLKPNRALVRLNRNQFDRLRDGVRVTARNVYGDDVIDIELSQRPRPTGDDPAEARELVFSRKDRR